MFLETQLEKQRRADQELKKKVLKLEFCLQEARSQTRKLQRVKLISSFLKFWSLFARILVQLWNIISDMF